VLINAFHQKKEMSHNLAVLSVSFFKERSLLAAILQADTQTAVLASDVWCFLAR